MPEALRCDCPPDKHAEWCANHPAQRAKYADGKLDSKSFPAGVQCDCPPGTSAEQPIAHREYCANHPAHRPAAAADKPAAAPKGGKPS